MNAARVLVWVLLIAQAFSVNLPAGESPAEKDKRMAWFREARFGLFIHWGVYSVPAGEYQGNTNYGEWFLEETRMPVSQYEKFAAQFNPVKFDAKAWVRMARDAGMKYIVITSKHHDGFGMFRSGQTDWCMKATPLASDPLKELAAACKSAGIRLCFYHSIMDWHHPDYEPRRAWNDVAKGEPKFDAYVAYMKGQLKELLTGYGSLGILWFDGEWENTWTWERGQDLYNYVRSLQPNIIINNRVGKGRAGMSGMDQGLGVAGDYGTPEQEIPPTGFGPGVDWESCMTMNNHWGYNKNDQNWKSAEELVHNLIDCASKGGNYLLNVGPTSEGEFPQPSIERLAAIGRWMKVNHESIYGTTASPFKRLPWGRCTMKSSRNGSTLYLHVWQWPKDGKLLVTGLKNERVKATLLGKKGSLPTQRQADGLSITVPTTAPDPISSTLVLRLERSPDVEAYVISQAPNGTVLLPASEARVHGSTLRYESGPQRDNIGFWILPEEWVDWNFKLNSAGTYELSAEVAARQPASFEVVIGQERKKFQAPVTGDYGAFQKVSLGFIRLTNTGGVLLEVHPISNGWNPINLKSIRLLPAPSYQ
jgi:alpha-L-fucosidase